MGLATIEPAEALPVTVAEAKSFARYPHDDDDALFAELIAAATDHVQQATSRQFVRAQFKLSMRDWPDDVIRLPRSPVLSVDTVTYRDRDGATVTLTATVDYLVDLSAEPATVEAVRRWPVVADHPAAVEITFTAGYAGDGGSPEDMAANVPARAKAAVKALAAHWYEFREPVVLGTVSEVPRHIGRLIAGLRVWR